jgi:hypothetical protein
MALEVFRDGFEIVDELALLAWKRACNVFEAMVEVIADQRFLRLGDGFFDRMELLREVEARSLSLNHHDDGMKMCLSPLEPLDDIGMGSVRAHGASCSLFKRREFMLSPRIGY